MKTKPNKSSTVVDYVQANTDTLSLQLENTKAELETAKQQTNQMQAVAQEAVNRLVNIETRLSPQVLRKPNLMTILFHWKELMLIIGEIVTLIKEFKDLIQKQPENDTTK